MTSTLGRKTPSFAGSRASVYSHGSTIRTFRTGGVSGKSVAGSRPGVVPWWKKPLVRHAFYTDLQRGSWHIGFYTVVRTVFPLSL